MVLYGLKEYPTLLRTKGGKAVHWICRDIIKGTRFEEVCFPKPTSARDQKMLADIRKKIWEVEDRREKENEETEIRQQRRALELAKELNAEKEKNGLGPLIKGAS